MKLYELMDILDDGCACFSILPYCEEYSCGLDELQEEPWYKKIKNMEVERVITIGSGMYKVETCIELKRDDEKSAEYIPKGKVMETINSYGGADASDPEDKRYDNLIGAIYADVDSIEPVVSGTDDIVYIVDGTCRDCGHEVAADWAYCPGCGRRLMA